MPNINTPTNQKLLTNVAVVRIKKGGKRFEIACYKNKVVSWRNRTETDLSEVLQTDTIFSNVSRGEAAKREDLKKSFSTENTKDICIEILAKGELQVSEKERQSHLESIFNEIASIISDKCVNPETKLPYPVTMIQKTMKEVHFSVKPRKNAKQQALELIPQLQTKIPIEKAKMKLLIKLTGKCAKKNRTSIASMLEDIESEECAGGDIKIMGKVDPGIYRQITGLLKRGDGIVEVLSFREPVVGDDILSY